MARAPTDQIQERLLQAAIAAFNRDGFHGTDSNRIAKSADLAAGTFYRHFKDKRAAFLGAYARYAKDEENALIMALAATPAPRNLAERLVLLLGAVHRNWRVFRASLRLLAATDPKVREAQRKHRSEILDMLGERGGGPPGVRERDALALLLLERAGEATADGDPKALQVDATRLARELVVQLEHLLTN